ncbi:MAG: hypothetical protein ACYDEX_04185 [Mobilitalea sp.]
MDKNKLIFIGKWFVMGMLFALNFLSYLVNGATLNIILTIVIFAYSAYEFFKAISTKTFNLGIKLYLFGFYLFAVISLLMGIRSLLTDNITSFLTSLLFIAGDVALILFTLHKLSENKG